MRKTDEAEKTLRECVASLAAEGRLLIWTIYDHPTDFPEHFVARAFIVEKGQAAPSPLVLVCEDLTVLRQKLTPFGLTCLPRYDADDPKIVEVWL